MSIRPPLRRGVWGVNSQAEVQAIAPPKNSPESPLRKGGRIDNPHKDSGLRLISSTAPGQTDVVASTVGQRKAYVIWPTTDLYPAVFDLKLLSERHLRRIRQCNLAL